jgi:hypothetical protein
VRLYLSGPITGVELNNRPAFARAAKWLRAAGHTVINPHEVCAIFDPHECGAPDNVCSPSELLLPWVDYLRADLIAMLQGSDAVAQLPGWEYSRGAVLEAYVADALGWEVKPWGDFLVSTPQQLVNP